MKKEPSNKDRKNKDSVTKNSLKKDNSKEFILEFFKGSNIKDEKGVLTVSEVNKEFEDFIGKKSPYKFVFDFNLHNNIADSELITQGSYFLLAIRDYLSDKGQTSLLKINIKSDLKELSKHPKLKKYKILGLKEENNGFLYKFSFLSTYQYLNDKKQSTTVLLVKDKEVLDLDISTFKTQKCSKEDIQSIQILNSQDSYQAAKKILDKKVSEEIKPIKLLLKKKLEKELFRVKDHYTKQIKEKDEEVETCANKIKMLQAKLRHTTYDRDISILVRMIRESGERLDMLKKKGYKARLQAEEKFHVTDEIEKHVLSIKNSLINVTVFYYPICNLLVSSKGKGKKTITYDPLLGNILI